MRMVLGSANPDKAAEIVSVLAPCGFDLLPRPGDVPHVEETGATLEENARLKAQALVAATGEAAVADDTGLEVAALDGAPGVHSARYAGPEATYVDNMARLLHALDGLASDQRRARFRTVALALFPDGREVVAEGVVEGRIADRPRGAGGFGYDAVFLPDAGDGGDGRTFAEMTQTEKNAVSHRGRAFRSLATILAIPDAATPGEPH